ncbi:putative phosphoesterase, alkaline-phosphatase-like, core domain superfamily [Helianthus annuus]|nr:putative phosphoesterase, alkaline-phosphatase-like, core domain superfamily [Helianthus annuus]
MENEAVNQNPIKTIVILVQENRSFDHMIGWVKSLNPEIDGVTGKESNPISTTNPQSGRLFQSNESGYIQPNPGHSFQAIYQQVFGVPWTEESSSLTLVPTMEGFVEQAESVEDGLGKIVMSGFKPDDVPVYRDLVKEFAVCDRWFASLPASTQPNRLYVHSATSHGLMSNDTLKLIKGFPQKTIFESLEESGFSFGIYYQYPPTTLFYSPDGIVGPEPYNFQFDRLGVRVPAILISPWIEPGTVLHEPSGPFPTSQYEHSSIPATVKKIFNLKEFLTKRDEWAGTFEGVLTRTTPRTDCPVALPEPEKMRHSDANEEANITDFQEELVQLGAVLKGDHKESDYPDKLVENMKVNEAAEYCQVAFKKFCDDCEKAKSEGKDESYIVCDGEVSSGRKTSKTFADKLFSCLVCDN